MKLSICIPTYNRPNNLPDCLNSIYLSSKKSNLKFEVCVSDNGSNYNLDKIITKYIKKIPLKINKNKKNIGYVRNLIKSISIAKGEFIWAIGDDDLLTLNALSEIENLFKKNKDVDFFYINSYHLDNNFLKKHPSPFNTKFLPKKMKKLSKKRKSMKLSFWDLIDYKISFDFLIGNFVNVFKREMWINNLNCLNKKNLFDTRLWSNFDNTCGPLKIYANAFKNSKAYFFAKALTVNTYNVREWSLMYPYIEIIRLPEALDYYRSRGLNLKSYLINKNYALRNFVNYFIKIILNREKSGYIYINFYKHIFKNLIYPNVYFSLFYFFFRKIKKILGIKIEKYD